MEHITTETMFLSQGYIVFEFFVCQVGFAFAISGEFIRSNISGLQQLFDFRNVVFPVQTVAENISFILEMIDSNDVLIHRIKDIWNCRFFIFFGNRHFFEITNGIISNVAK